MASPFDALDDAASSAVLATFGERVVLRPRASEQYVERQPDVDRNETTVWGIFSAGPGAMQIKGQAMGKDLGGTTRINTLESEFWIGREQVEALPFAVTKGDVVRFVERLDCPVYAVSTIQRTHMGDLNLLLVREDQPE